MAKVASLDDARRRRKEEDQRALRRQRRQYLRRVAEKLGITYPHARRLYGPLWDELQGRADGRMI